MIRTSRGSGRLATGMVAAVLAVVPWAVLACAQPSTDILPLSGPYLGQTPPGDRPELFAPGVVSTGMYTRDIAMTPDGTEIYFGVLVGPFATIMETSLRGGRWRRPEVAPFARDARFINLEPAISPDGSRFFFLSNRVPGADSLSPQDLEASANQDIWVMDRLHDRWGDPYNLGPPVNTDDSEFFPSITNDGTLYFTRSPASGGGSFIYRSRLRDGRYQEPEKLGPEVNSTVSQYNAFVAPDESYIILCTGGRSDTRGGTDYYIVFRKDDDTWSEPVNLGDSVNSAGNAEFSPYVSRDGRFFFFMTARARPDSLIPHTLTRDFLMRYRVEPGSGNPAIYWMDASFLEGLREAASVLNGDSLPPHGPGAS